MPLDAADRDHFRRTAAGIRIFSVLVAIVAAGILSFGVVEGVTGDVVAMIFSCLFGMFVLAIFGVLFYFGRRAGKDAQAPEKIVYSGLVTDKRVEHSRTHDANGQHVTSTTHYLQLDGVDFRVDVGTYATIEKGLRADFHCIRPGDVFRVTRA